MLVTGLETLAIVSLFGVHSLPCTSQEENQDCVVDGGDVLRENSIHRPACQSATNLQSPKALEQASSSAGCRSQDPSYLYVGFFVEAQASWMLTAYL